MTDGGIALWLGALFLVAVLWSSREWTTPLLGMLVGLPILSMYPLFVAIAVTRGIRFAAGLWIVLACAATVLERAVPPVVPRPRRRWFGFVWQGALFWPFLLMCAVAALRTRLGLVPALPEIHLRPPPRGPGLLALPDDDLLSAAHQILSGGSDLTADERAVLTAESFNRGLHCDGLIEWLCDTDTPLGDTIHALRTVGAPATAGILEQASASLPVNWRDDQSHEARQQALKSVETILDSLEKTLFSQEHREDLTSVIVRFIKRDFSRYPALRAVPDGPAVPPGEVKQG
jgi:hypothetical protein